MGLFDDDLSFITGDVFSSPVMFGSQSTRGILTINDASRSDPSGMGSEARVTTLVVPVNALAGVVLGSSVFVVDGVSYTVRDGDPSDDGRAETYYLTKVQ